MSGQLKKIVRIGLVGDYSAEIVPHVAIPRALALAATDLGLVVEETWLPTENVIRDMARLPSFDGLWCVPASPYVSMEGALAAIRFAREHPTPFLGTCGGFQHAVLEYARNVMGLEEADHAESNPDAAMPLIAPLYCSLVDQEGGIMLKAGSRAAAIYGRNEIIEKYQCNYGVGVKYQPLFDEGNLQVTGVDAAGEVRVVELAGHPFFFATLFQPERSAFSGTVHPLIRAYVEAAAGR